MRTLAELIATPDPAWPQVQSWIRDSKNPVEILPADADRRAGALISAQVTLHSSLGAVIYETGGLLIDNGWIRVLGSGSDRLPRSVPERNTGKTLSREEAPPPFLLVADDVLGGFFAINGGGLGSETGNVYYFATDTLEWESLGRGYTDFLLWLFTGDLEMFYEPYRWNGWREEVSNIRGDEAFSIYPFLSAQGPSIELRSRRTVPIDELYKLHVDAGA